MQVILATLAPFIKPIAKFAAQTVSTSQLAGSAAAIQTMQIVSAINAALVLASSPVDTFVAQTGVTDALATLQAAMAA